MSRAFVKYSWGLLIYNLIVAVWGVYVRASSSGDGCGSHWPDCGGAYLAVAGHGKTLVEFLHRASTELDGLLILGLAVWAFLAFPRGSIVKKSSLLAVAMTGVEALIGRHLVLNSYVALNSSPERVVWLSLHLVSIFILLACLGSTAMWASGTGAPTLKKQGAVGWALGIAFLGALLLGISGAMSALGDTLFKSDSLVAGIMRDFSPAAHFLLRLRPLHPLIAVSVGVYSILVAGLMYHFRPSEQVKKWGQWLVALFLLQIAIGVLDLFILAPIWMQLIHVLFANVLWLSLIALGASALSKGVPRNETENPEPEPLEFGERSLRTTIKAYIALTKPRVISLLLFTTLTAMFAAARGWPGFWLFLAVTVGGYMSAGAANAINMVIDRDIDRSMKRTANRPTVTQYISTSNALLFGIAMEVGSFALLWSVANLLSAMLALAGLAFYVVIYTLILKRRTWHNIVIGGAAGSFPPLVGWAAVTGQISPLAWLLFAIIFVWTPVHFWALALMIKDDYALAGVPMLPVVRGERATVIQILLYAVLTVIISVMPYLQPHVGLGYVAVALLLNVFLLAKCLQLFLRTERPQAVSLYKYSMVYLAVLFLAIAIDRGHFS